MTTSNATETHEPPTPEKPPARSLGSIIAVVLAAVFGVTTVLLAVVAVGLKSDKDQLEETRREVETASGRFVQALVDYRFDDVGSLRDDVLPLSADPFTEQFEAGVPQIQALNESLGRASQGTIRNVFVAAVEGEEATAIVVYDAVETFADREPIPYQNVYVRLGLVRLGGDWKVNDVINLNLALQQPAAGPGSTTTTAPPG